MTQQQDPDSPADVSSMFSGKPISVQSDIPKREITTRLPSAMDRFLSALRRSLVGTPPISSDVKTCLACAEVIRFESSKCMHCGSNQSHEGAADLGLAMALMPATGAFAFLCVMLIQPHPDDQAWLIFEIIYGVFFPCAILAAFDAHAIAKRRNPANHLAAAGTALVWGLVVFAFNGIGLVYYCVRRRLLGAPSCAGLAIFTCTLLASTAFVADLSATIAQQKKDQLDANVRRLETIRDDIRDATRFR